MASIFCAWRSCSSLSAQRLARRARARRSACVSSRSRASARRCARPRAAPARGAPRCGSSGALRSVMSSEMPEQVARLPAGRPRSGIFLVCSQRSPCGVCDRLLGDVHAAAAAVSTSRSFAWKNSACSVREEVVVVLARAGLAREPSSSSPARLKRSKRSVSRVLDEDHRRDVLDDRVEERRDGAGAPLRLAQAGQSLDQHAHVVIGQRHQRDAGDGLGIIDGGKFTERRGLHGGARRPKVQEPAVRARCSGTAR